MGHADRDGNLFDLCLVGGTERGRRDTVEAAVLVADDQTVLRVIADVDPGAFLLFGNGVKQLDLEAFRDVDLLGRRGECGDRRFWFVSWPRFAFFLSFGGG